MKSDVLRRAIGEIDDALIENADTQAAPARARAPFVKKAAAAAAIIAVISAALFFSVIRNGGDNVSSGEESRADTASEGTEETSRTNTLKSGDYLIGSGVVIAADTAHIEKRLPTYGAAEVTMCSYLSADIQRAAENGYDAASDPCLEIIAQWYSAAYSFDIERVFSVFTDEQVESVIEKTAVKNPALAGADRGTLAEMTADISKYFRVGDVTVTYDVISIEDITESYIAENSQSLVETGIDVSGVMQVKKYGIKNISAVFFGSFDFRPNIDKFIFLEYRGRWYCGSECLKGAQQLLELAADKNEYVTGTMTVRGRVTEIGDGYVIAGKVLLLTDDPGDIAVDDDIVAVVYKNAGASVWYAGENGAILDLHTLVSARRADEWQDGQID